MRTGLTLIGISSALVVGFTAGAAQTGRAPIPTLPTSIADVRPGMQRDAVLSGLGELYRLSKFPYPPSIAAQLPAGDEIWTAVSKDTNTISDIYFTNYKVTSTDEFLTQTYDPEAARFLRELFTYIEQVAQPEPDKGSGMRSFQRGTLAATLELEELSLPAGNLKRIGIRTKDFVYQISVADHSDNPGPLSQIRRIRDR
jgi:hypothetical protein